MIGRPDLLPGENEVLVLRVDVAASASAAHARIDMLSADERERIARLHRAEDRDRAAVAAVLARSVVGAMLGVEPEDVPLVRGPHGKPNVCASRDPVPAFNLSHSGAFVLAAFTHGRDVGVDIERAVGLPLDELAAMGESVFTPEERAEWSALPEPARPAAFYRLWTRKEAYLKGTGEGVADGVQHVRFGAGTDAILLSDLRAPDAPARWQLASLDVAPEYAAALAVARPAGALNVAVRLATGTPFLSSANT